MVEITTLFNHAVNKLVMFPTKTLKSTPKSKSETKSNTYSPIGSRLQLIWKHGLNNLYCCNQNLKINYGIKKVALLIKTPFEHFISLGQNCKFFETLDLNNLYLRNQNLKINPQIK